MISGLGNIQRMQNFMMKGSFCMLALVGILFMLFSVPCAIADDELENLEAEYVKLYKEYLRAREIIRARESDEHRDKYTDEDEFEANFTIEEFGTYGRNLATRIKSLGGDLDKIKRKAEMPQKEGTKKLELDELKKEDFKPRQWEKIDYYRKRIKSMGARLDGVKNPEGSYAKSIRRKIKEYEEEIKQVVDQTPKRKNMRVPQGVKLRGTVDGKSIEKTTPKKLRPWELGDWVDGIRVTNVDEEFMKIYLESVTLPENYHRHLEAYLRWWKSSNYPKGEKDVSQDKDKYREKRIEARSKISHDESKWIKGLKDVKSLKELKDEYHKGQDIIREQLLTINETWSRREWDNLSNKLQRLLGRMLRIERRLLWLFGSNDSSETSNREWFRQFKVLNNKILIQASEAVDAEIVLEKKRKYLKDIEHLRNAPDVSAELRIQKAEHEVNETTAKHAELTRKLKALKDQAKKSLEDRIEQRYIRARRRLSDANQSFKVHTEFETESGNIRIDYRRLSPFMEDNKTRYERLVEKYEDMPVKIIDLR